MIEGVRIKEFADLEGELGSIQHMLSADHDFFERFGEVYFTSVKPGVTKGWNAHTKQTNILSCISGKAKIMLKDLREDSPTKDEEMIIFFGDGNRKLVKLPPGVAFSWKSETAGPAMLANLATHPHDPAEGRKIPLDELSFGGD